jgi:predicted short-subunit dehydrogenase-like oxidoreductase (DUF2520 family)
VRCAVVGAGPVGRFLGARLGVEPLRRHGLPPDDVELVFLAVPDRVITEQASRLRDLGNWALVHCSGATALSALGQDAAAVWHPMRAFADNLTPPTGLDYAVVGLRGEASIVAWLEFQTRSWGGQPVRLAEDQAVRVHAACCFAAGFCASIAGHAAQIFTEAGLTTDEANLAVAGLSDSAIASMLAGQGLTGPALRGDHQTVASHLRQLEGRAELYRSLTLSMTAHATLSDPVKALLE